MTLFKTEHRAKLRESKLDRERPCACTRPGSVGCALGAARLGKSAARSRTFLGLALEEGEDRVTCSSCLLIKAQEKKQPGGRQRCPAWGVMVGKGPASCGTVPVLLRIQQISGNAQQHLGAERGHSINKVRRTQRSHCSFWSSQTIAHEQAIPLSNVYVTQNRMRKQKLFSI